MAPARWLSAAFTSGPQGVEICLRLVTSPTFTPPSHRPASLGCLDSVHSLHYRGSLNEGQRRGGQDSQRLAMGLATLKRRMLLESWGIPAAAGDPTTTLQGHSQGSMPSQNHVAKFV